MQDMKQSKLNNCMPVRKKVPLSRTKSEPWEMKITTTKIAMNEYEKFMEKDSK